MIKIRRHAQKKAEKERAAAGGSSRSRETDARNYHKEDGVCSRRSSSSRACVDSATQAGQVSRDDYLRLDSSRTGDTHRPPVRSPGKGSSNQHIYDAFDPSHAAPSFTFSPTSQKQRDAHPLPPQRSSSHMTSAQSTSPSPHRPPVFSPSTMDLHLAPSQPERLMPDKQNTLPTRSTLDRDSDATLRRNSLNDIRSSDVLFGQNSSLREDSPTPGGIPLADAPSKGSLRNDDFRSNNPGVRLVDADTQPVGSPTSSPSAMTFGLTLANEQGSEGQLSLKPISSPMQSPVSGGFHDGDHIHHPDAQQPTSRSAPVHPCETEEEQTGHRAALSPLTADQIPPRSHSLTKHGVSHESSSAIEMPTRSQHNLAPGSHADGNTLRPQRSFDDRSRSGHRLSSRASLNLGLNHSTSSGPPSPAHQADVPHGVESGTDTDAEGVGGLEPASPDALHPPPTPPSKSFGGQDLTIPMAGIDPETPGVSQVNSAEGSDEAMESSTVERTSHSTFIAPALPPIRFSMTGSDFRELLGLSEFNPSLNALEKLAKISEEHPDYLTPPSTASLFDGMTRPLSDLTVMASSENSASRTSLATDESMASAGNDVTIMTETSVGRDVASSDGEQ
jgi:hypothetical protein